jgi:CBS domain-containing protein
MTKCVEVMTKNPVFAVATDTVDKVAQLMKKEDVGPIPVVDKKDSKKLIGIVTDRDLAMKIVAEGRDPKKTRVEEVMTRNPVTCREDDDLKKALDAMTHHQVRRIPVVNDKGQIVGIIAQADIATRVEDPRTTARVVEQISKP